MIGTDQKVKEIIEWFKENEPHLGDKYSIGCDDLYDICQDFMFFFDKNNELMENIRKLEDYNRLLRDENARLRGEKIC